MKTFNIRCKVEQCAGFQYWTVEADNEAEALKKFEDGDADLEDELVDVIHCGKPEFYTPTE